MKVINGTTFQFQRKLLVLLGNVFFETNLVHAFKNYVMKSLHKSSIFLISDWYHDYYIKGVTRKDRDGNACCSHNLSLLTTLPSKEVTLHLTETKKQLIELLAEGLLKVYTNAPGEKKLVITSQSEYSVQVHLGIKTPRHYPSASLNCNKRRSNVCECRQ